MTSIPRIIRCHVTVFCLAIAGFLLTGCASNGINPASLKKPAIESTAIIRNSYSFVRKISIPFSPVISEGTYALAAGKYVAEFEDENGVYFRGLKNCLTIVIETPIADKPPIRRELSRQGGIFVPHSRIAPALVYLVKDMAEFVPKYSYIPSVTNSPINALALTYDDGNIIIPDSQPGDDSLRSVIDFYTR